MSTLRLKSDAHAACVKIKIGLFVGDVQYATSSGVMVMTVLPCRGSRRILHWTSCRPPEYSTIVLTSCPNAHYVDFGGNGCP